MSTRIQRAQKYLKKNGFAKTVKKTWKVSKNILLESRSWKYYLATEEELEQQKNISFTLQPKLSILIPMFNTPVDYFKELMDTIIRQTYTNWELCLADGSGKDTEAYAYVKELQKTDSRIQYQRLADNGGISENTNAALDMATGDFIVLCDHDDLLTKDAFFYVVQALNEDEEIDTLYTDEDKLDMRGKRFFEPSFKPDFNIDFFRGGNYICHMFVTKSEIAKQVRFKKEYDGAQDYDFIFRCCEASRKIHHIPRLLYHWRCHRNSTAGNPESKLYAYEAGVRALQAHLDRCGIQATAEMSEFWGYYFTRYEIVGQPKVSVISGKQLSKTLQSNMSYENLEMVLFEGEYTPDNINKAVKQATGEILFFVDPRIQQLEEHCFERLLGPLQREDLASTFARVYNQKEILYSGGMLMGIRGLFGRSCPAVERENNGYAMHLLISQDMQASDLTCAMIRKVDFDAVGGMEESLGTIHACVDLYLKMGRLGKKHLFEPQAVAQIQAPVEEGDEWLDYGDISQWDDAFRKKWHPIVSTVDAVYNPNLDNSFGGYLMKSWSVLKREAGDKR